MLKSLFIFCCSLIGFCHTKTFCQDTIAYWSFNEKTGEAIMEKVSKISYPVHTMRSSVEHVSGFSGNGLRTDGNSTWIVGKIKSTGQPFSISGWFALETYPTDTAGFFSLSDTVKGKFISACVDKFGRSMIGIKANNEVRYIGGDKTVSKFKWTKIGLSVDKEKIVLFVDGKQSLVLTSGEAFTSFDQIIIGRDSREKKINIFPVTAINGIIDEVAITGGDSFQSVSSSQEKQSKQLPDLSIPEERFKNDFNRPLYHLLPSANWTNETHGLVYYNNRYHVFNQKNGGNVFLGQINWGHFSSKDLVHWVEHVPALTPQPGYDEYGIWSGHVVVEKGQPVITYSCGSSKAFAVGMAYPKDKNLIGWNKYADNPVIEGQPGGFSRKDLHDPYLWKEADVWYMIIGFGVIEKDVKKGSLLLYKSTDLKKWTFLHTMFTGNPEKDDSGVFWEMPVFWKMNGKYILLVNKVPPPQGPAVALYWTGKFENEKFIPDQEVPKRLEVVNRLLSPSVNFDAEGRTTAIAIIPDETSAQAQYQQGWTHLYSIPRTWSLVNDSIRQAPHPALLQLRGEKKAFTDKTILPGSNMPLSKGRHQLEIVAEMVPGDCQKFGFVVGKNSDNSEWTKIYFDFTSNQIIVDQAKSSKKNFIPLDTRVGSYKLDRNQKAKFRVFIDGSVIEVFINDKDAFTTRLFPKYANSNEVEIFSEGGPTKLIKAEVYHLKSANLKTDFRVPEAKKKGQRMINFYKR